MFRLGAGSSSRPRKHAGARRTRRVAIITAATLALMIGAPSGAAPTGGEFPLSWLWSWLRQPATYAASAWEGMPRQPHGPGDGSSHYVSAEATRANGGAGHTPAPTPHGLPAASRPRRASVPSTAPVTGANSFDAKTSKRVAGLSSATTDMCKNTDGSYTQKVYGRPVNYRDADGVWTPIDSTLVKHGDGRYHVAANSFQISVAGHGAGTRSGRDVIDGAAAGPDAADPATATSPLVSMTLPGGWR